MATGETKPLFSWDDVDAWEECGTSLTWDGGLVGLYIGTLDYPESFPPTQHIFHRDRVSWFETSDELPRYPTMP